MAVSWSSGLRSSKEAGPLDLLPYLGLDAKAKSPNILCSIENCLSPRVEMREDEKGDPEGGAKDFKDRVSRKGLPWMKMLQVRMTIKKIERKRDILIFESDLLIFLCRSFESLSRSQETKIMKK